MTFDVNYIQVLNKIIHMHQVEGIIFYPSVILFNIIHLLYYVFNINMGRQSMHFDFQTFITPYHCR